MKYGIIDRMLSKQNKEVLIKRFKSFVWRSAVVGLVVALDFISTNLGLFDLPSAIVVTAGLVLGEISKYINSYLLAKN